MPDEITPEQWREWRDDPRTKKLLIWLEGEAKSAEARRDAERRKYPHDNRAAYHENTGEMVGYMMAARAAGNPTGKADEASPPADVPSVDGRRVTVQG